MVGPGVGGWALGGPVGQGCLDEGPVVWVVPSRWGR